MTCVIKLDNIYKDYNIAGDNIYHALKGLNLEVNKGDFVAIMGPSGCGKTTTMNIIGCLDTATSGKYYLNNKDISNATSDELANIRNKSLGFVFQGFNLLQKRSVFDNVALPLIYSDHFISNHKEKIVNILKAVKLDKFMTHYPSQLSGGMQQRTAIARALINDPAVLLADEPTGNLDTNTSIEIMRIFQELNDKYGITIVMVTHEPDIGRYAKRLVLIRDGTKQFDDTIEKAIKDGLI